MGKSQTTTTTETGPWKPAQGALQDILSRAQSAGTSDAFSPTYGAQTMDSLGMVENVARSGTNASLQSLGPLVQRAGQGYQTGFDALSASARGDMLNNPYISDYLRASNDAVANRVNAQFSGAGRYGGNGAHTGALADALSRNTNQVMMDQYNRERGNQMQAAGILHNAGFQGASMAPQLDQAQLYNARLLADVGAQRDAMAMAEKQAPLRALDWQKGVIGGIGGLGQSGSTTQSTPPNRLGQILGGAMAVGGMLTGNPSASLGGLGQLLGSQSVPGALGLPRNYVNPYQYEGYGYSAAPGRMGFGVGV
jgi:hypothetical protein